MNDPFAPAFGTWRGALRLALAHGEVALGRAAILPPDPQSVRRLVFVCHGNICRSAYAHVLAREAGMNVASFGLSTGSGKPAWPAAQTIAEQRGVDLSRHRSARIEDFISQPGDYLLGMEVRHLRRLAADPRLARLPRGLLGSYAAPSFPHLHDPYKLSDAYMVRCLTRIEQAVAGLVKACPGATAA